MKPVIEDQSRLDVFTSIHIDSTAEDLPNELWSEIISFLGISDRKSVRLTCKKMAGLVAETDLFDRTPHDCVMIKEVRTTTQTSSQRRRRRQRRGAGKRVQETRNLLTIDLDDDLPKCTVEPAGMEQLMQRAARFFKRIVLRPVKIDLLCFTEEIMEAVENVMKMCTTQRITIEINHRNQANDIMIEFLEKHPCDELKIVICDFGLDPKFLLRLPQPAKLDMILYRSPILDDEMLINLARKGHTFGPRVDNCSAETFKTVLEIVATRNNRQTVIVHLEDEVRDQFLELIELRFVKGEFEKIMPCEHVVLLRPVYPEHAVRSFEYKGAKVTMNGYFTGDNMIFMTNIQY